MIFIDVAIIAILAVSGLISLWRGFVKEAINLVSWIAALVIARQFSYPLAAVLSDWIDDSLYQYITAFAILFIVTLMLGALVNHVLSTFIRWSGLSWLDRLLGMAFGFLRGVVIVLVLLALGQLLALDSYWEQSQIVPYLNPLLRWVSKSIMSASDAFLSY